MVQSLPIDPLVPEILRCIERNTLTLLQAEPGAGKTTRVPPALLAAGFERVYVLEPRRLAARMAARRVAQEMGESVGQTVGFQVRFEQTGGANTKLWYLTEGVLTQRLLGKENLPESSVVVLDEFHERHIETDLAFALLRNRQTRLLIMSATLGDFAGAPLIRAPGRLFPVKIEYRPHSAAPLEEQAALAVADAIARTKKHILVFLPGAAEIRNTIAGYQLDRAHWGQRFIAEAAMPVLAYAFHRLKLERVVAFARPENVRSERVLERLGFRRHPTRLYKEEVGQNCRLYALSRGDWQH